MNPSIKIFKILKIRICAANCALASDSEPVTAGDPVQPPSGFSPAAALKPDGGTQQIDLFEEKKICQLV